MVRFGREASFYEAAAAAATLAQFAREEAERKEQPALLLQRARWCDEVEAELYRLRGLIDAMAGHLERVDPQFLAALRVGHPSAVAQ